MKIFKIGIKLNIIYVYLFLNFLWGFSIFLMGKEENFFKWGFLFCVLYFKGIL